MIYKYLFAFLRKNSDKFVMYDVLTGNPLQYTQQEAAIYGLCTELSTLSTGVKCIIIHRQTVDETIKEMIERWWSPVLK